MTMDTYNIPNIVKLLKGIDSLSGCLNFEALIRHVTVKTEHERQRTKEVVPVMASRKTLQKYIRLCRDIDDANDPNQINRLKNIFKVVPKNAFYYLKEYLELTSPDIFSS